LRSEGERARSIAALLNRLALHCPFRDLPESQAALRMEDTITDLLEYDPQQVAIACDEWRRGRNPFFPVSGQLIDLIQKRVEASIANRRANKPAYRAPQIEGPRAVLKPYRQILAEKGLALPPTPDEQPPKPAEQEQLDATGSLSPERRDELRALRERLLGGDSEC